MWESEKEDAVLFCCFFTVLACWHNDYVSHTATQEYHSLSSVKTLDLHLNKKKHTAERNSKYRIICIQRCVGRS